MRGEIHCTTRRVAVDQRTWRRGSVSQRDVRALIVDDESLARERLRTLLGREPDVEVIGECGDGACAVEMIRSLSPDLVFLDVQMPVLGGFEVVSTIGADRMPPVIFATAHDEHALRAFDVHAVDYLLKPIGAERLRAALARIRRWIGEAHGTQLSRDLHPLLADVAVEGRRFRDRIAVRSGTRYTLVKIEDVTWMEADDNNVRLHVGAAVHSMRSTLRDVEMMLDPQRFLRIHRSIIVAIDRVSGIESWGMGEFLLILSDGTKLTSSRTYRRSIQEVFGC